MEQEVPVYVPGETIRCQLSFTHKMLITGVEATFTYQGEEETNMRSIRMVPEEGLRSSGTSREGDYFHTIIDLVSEGRVPANVFPEGEYRLTEVRAQSYLEKVHRLTGIPDIRCRIVRGEPAEPPKFEGLSWYS